jgi:nucleoside-diphosphate-sugar epimerase
MYVAGTVSVLVAAKDCRVPTVVAAASSSVNGDTPGFGVMVDPTRRRSRSDGSGSGGGDLAVVKERWCRRRVWRRRDS